MNSAATAEAYLGLGANLGDPIAMLRDALLALDAVDGITVSNHSSLYRTSPVGKTDQPDFINMVVRIETTLTPESLMATLLNIESRMGRKREDRWGPRTIDIDLLLHGQNQIHTDTLTVPHPRMLERRFVLVPLLEIAPDLIVPGVTLSLQDSLNKVDDQGNIQPLDHVLLT